jgi:hypothetical protein
MRLGLFLFLLGAVACGGSGTVLTPKDMDPSPDAATPGGKPDASTTTTVASVPDTCMHICSCFTQPGAPAACTPVCQSWDSRYIGTGSSAGPGNPYSFGVIASSAGYELFQNSSSLPVHSSGELPNSKVPPNACLSCLATATCTELASGHACRSVCPRYE